MLSFPASIFISSFLLFQIQLVLSKFILPWFGGVAGVWTTCMLFFQLLLFAGYAYAFAVSKYLTFRRQLTLHLCLLVVSLFFLPVTPNLSWKPQGGESPVPYILGLLFSTVGLPYFLVAANTPLLQSWYVRARAEALPYRLYALSNFSSFLALLSYPFCVERVFGGVEQTVLWSWGYVLFIISLGFCGVLTLKNDAVSGKLQLTRGVVAANTNLRWGDYVLWMTLSACGVMLLVSVTNFMCQDVAVVPLLWVMPLGIYLLTYVLAFDDPGWYKRELLLGIFASLSLAALFFNPLAPGRNILWVIGFFLLLLFVTCMLCHGELAKSKPHPDLLTSFYIMSSAGGAVGGIIVGLLCPLIFYQFSELPFALLLCVLLAILTRLKREGWQVACLPSLAVKTAVGSLALGILAITLYVDRSNPPLAVSRNFFGIVRVLEKDLDNPERARREMLHGRVFHGLQFLREDKRRQATAYAGPDSGAGLAARFFPREGPRSIAVVGLGPGVMATFGRKNDRMFLYEIDPQVIRLAQTYFTFLEDSEAALHFVPGDARLSLQRAEDGQFDLLFLDAFNGDSIPVHLLTLEAFHIYLEKLRHDGAIVLNISNLYLDFRPLLAGVVQHFGLKMAVVSSEGDVALGLIAADYAIITDNQSFVDLLERNSAVRFSDGARGVSPVTWTDNYNNIFQLMR